MKFSIYTSDEARGAEVDFEASVKLTKEVLDAANEAGKVTQDKIEEGEWRSGRLASDWKMRYGEQEVTYKKGAIVLADLYELTLIEQPKGMK